MLSFYYFCELKDSLQNHPDGFPAFIEMPEK